MPTAQTGNKFYDDDDKHSSHQEIAKYYTAHKIPLHLSSEVLRQISSDSAEAQASCLTQVGLVYVTRQADPEIERLP